MTHSSIPYDYSLTYTNLHGDTRANPVSNGKTAQARAAALQLKAGIGLNKENVAASHVGDGNGKQDVQPQPLFSPRSLAKYNMKQIEDELSALKERQMNVFEEVKRSSQASDEETFEQYLEFFSRWKELFSTRISSYKQELVRQEMELIEFRDYSESLVRVAILM